jgi:hypothetical protein
MPLLRNFYGREMLSATFAALHEFVHRTTTCVTVLSPLQKDLAEGPTRVVEGSLRASDAGSIHTAPQAIEGTVEKMATER